MGLWDGESNRQQTPGHISSCKEKIRHHPCLPAARQSRGAWIKQSPREESKRTESHARCLRGAEQFVAGYSMICSAAGQEEKRTRICQQILTDGSENMMIRLVYTFREPPCGWPSHRVQRETGRKYPEG